MGVGADTVDRPNVSADPGVPLGYKHTEAGVLPADWTVTDVGSLYPFVTSGSRGWAKYYANAGRPFIRIGNVSRASIYLDLTDLKLVHLPEPGDAEAARTSVQDGDLLVSITADIGIVAYVDESVDKPAYINQHLAIVRVSQQSVCNKFIAYYLASERPQRLFVASKDVGAKAGMNLTTVRKIRLVLPHPGEQEAIAEALSDVDGLIGALEALIAKKRAIKQAAMQQLLTAKTRLPGFTGEWKSKQLGAVLKVRHGRSQKGVAADDGKYPILASGGEIGRTNISLHDGPSVLIGRKGTIDAPQFSATPFWTVDTLFYTEISNGNSAKFIYYKFCMIPWRNYNEASGVPSLNARTIENIEVQLPDRPEQEAIATVLTDMDAEISTLEQRLQKTRAIKQGMMQQLLTGRIRLVKPAAPATVEGAAN